MFDRTVDRTKGIFASEAAEILGLSPYGGPWDVWMRKTKQAPYDATNAYTRAGDALEPLIGELYSERTGDVLEPCQTKFHPDYPMIGATPDWTVVGAPRLVEAKAVMTPGSAKLYGEEGSGIFPERHAVQAMIQLACFNLDETALAALVSGQLRVYQIARDRDTERLLCDQLAAWWDAHIVKGDPPAVDGSPVVRDWLVKKFPRNTGEMLTADEFVKAMMYGMFAVKNRIAQDEENLDAIKNRICQLIADKDGIVAPGVGKVTWRRTKDSQKTDWDCVANTLAKFAPEGEFDKIVEMHTTTKPGTRRFLMTEEKDDG